MKLSLQIIFFGIVLSIYGLINYYIYKRALPFIPLNYKFFFTISFLIVVVSFIAGRFLERVSINLFSDVLIWVGSFWLAFMFYFFLALVLIDLLRLINLIIPFFPAFITHNIEKTKNIVALSVLILVVITVFGGYINTKTIITKTYKITAHKNLGELKTLNIAMASDLHLGTLNGKSYLNKLVTDINKLNPDIILLVGDIIDEDLASVIKYNVGEELVKLKSKYGIYTVTGNHEYIGGVEEAVKYLSEHGVNVLRDTFIKIDNSFYLAGREDRAIKQFAGKRRKELKDILNGVDKSNPIILMDHQPFGLKDAKENEVDLQLSGHTHNGQLWPINYIVSKIYELSWGYLVDGSTHYYVSCGVGGWGPPVRTGSRPEIINIKLSCGDYKK